MIIALWNFLLCSLLYPNLLFVVSANKVSNLAPRSKALHCGLKIIDITTYLAAGVFNEDHSFILRIMNMLDIIIDRQSKLYVDDNK